MNFKEEMHYFQEPNNGNFSLHRNPGFNSTDNGPLWNATYLDMLSPGERGNHKAWFRENLIKRQVSPGLYKKYPGSVHTSSHDNLIGDILCADFVRDEETLAAIYEHAKKNWYCFYTAEHKPTFKEKVGAFFGRIPGVIAMVRVSNKKSMGIIGITLMIVGLLLNMTEERTNTSGRCLLLLQTRYLLGRNALLDLVIGLWLGKMQRLYHNGPRELRAIFFGALHPFTTFSKEKWL